MPACSARRPVQIEEVARRFGARRIDLAVIAARGTSDHAALYAQYILGARNGCSSHRRPHRSYRLRRPAAAAQGRRPGDLPVGRSPGRGRGPGESRRPGALTVAITNDPDSELAVAAEYLIELEAGPERAVAATKTYLAEIAVVAMLSAALSGDEASRDELGRCRLPSGSRSLKRTRVAPAGRGLGARRAAAPSWLAASTTPLPANGPSSSRSWPTSWPIPIRPRTSSTARSP